nr:MAG TPA: hypothetical protein [Caudoviricetes sp.]DAS57592.1 MAG TPA: hypothetical protein [Caudoviricetes sp.]
MIALNVRQHSVGGSPKINAMSKASHTLHPTS